MGKEEIERSVEQFIENNDIQGEIDTFDEYIKKVHRHNKKKRTVQDTSEAVNFNSVNESFEEFLRSLSDSKSSLAETQVLPGKYITESSQMKQW